MLYVYAIMQNSANTKWVNSKVWAIYASQRDAFSQAKNLAQNYRDVWTFSVERFELHADSGLQRRGGDVVRKKSPGVDIDA